MSKRRMSRVCGAKFQNLKCWVRPSQANRSLRHDAWTQSPFSFWTTCLIWAEWFMGIAFCTFPLAPIMFYPLDDVKSNSFVLHNEWDMRQDIFFSFSGLDLPATPKLLIFFFFVRRCDCMSINCVYVWVPSYQFDPRTNYVVLWGILPFLFFMQVSSTCDAGQNFQPGVRCRETMHWWCDGKRSYSVFGFLHVWFVLYRILNCQLEVFVLIAHGSKSSVAIGQVTVVLLRQLSCSANVP